MPRMNRGCSAPHRGRAATDGGRPPSRHPISGWRCSALYLPLTDGYHRWLLTDGYSQMATHRWLVDRIRSRPLCQVVLRTVTVPPRIPGPRPRPRRPHGLGRSSAARHRGGLGELARRRRKSVFDGLALDAGQFAAVREAVGPAAVAPRYVTTPHPRGRRGGGGM